MKSMEERPKATFSWFPGHMKSAWRQLEQQLKDIDLLLFVLDARIPRSSQHPELLKALQRRPLEQIWILNKVDLAQPEETRRWLQELAAQHRVVEMQSKSGSGLGALTQPLADARQRLQQRRDRRSLLERPLRMMVIGLPNVGKSSLLNRLVGRASAKTGKKPGLTRGKSNWVQGPEGIQVLDSPGILYPRIETWEQLAHLAACGNVKPEILPLFEVGTVLLQRLHQLGHGAQIPEGAQDLDTLGRRLGTLLKGGEIDYDRAAQWLLQHCFTGKLGRLTWEPLP